MIRAPLQLLEPIETLERRLATPAGFDARAPLAFLARRAFAGVEAVSPENPERWSRTFELGGAIGQVAVRPRPGRLAIRVTGGTPAIADAVRARVAAVFDLAAPVGAVRELLGRDRILGRLLGERDLRIPRAWDPFELAIRAILGQQISVAAASTLAARLIRAHGERLPNAIAIDGLTYRFPERGVLATADLTALGVIGARARAINSLARAAADDPGLFAGARPLEAIVDALARQPGIGPWTAHYIALRGFGAADAFPRGDLGLIHGYARLAGKHVSSTELDRVAERWRPYRGYAAVLLWSAPGRGGQGGR